MIKKKIIDWYLSTGEPTARNGLGYTVRISSNAPFPNHDSIITQIVDSVENGYELRWIVENTGQIRKGGYEFFGNGERLPVSIAYYPNKTLAHVNAHLPNLSVGFHDNGNIEYIRYEVGGNKNSYCYQWYPGGTLECSYQIMNGHKNGPYITFHENGLINEIGYYTQVSGSDTSYVDDIFGNQKMELTPTHYTSVKHGTWKTFNLNGTLIKIEHFEKGKLLSK